jgi:hypothetical protein
MNMKKPRIYGKRWIESEKKRRGASQIHILRNETGRVVAIAYSNPIKIPINPVGVELKREPNGTFLIG